MTTYTIVHDYDEEPDRRLTLCADGYFRSGTWATTRRESTLIYKSLWAARKRLRKVCKISFPRASVFIYK